MRQGKLVKNISNWSGANIEHRKGHDAQHKNLALSIISQPSLVPGP
jgi:hypothetical protein